MSSTKPRPCPARVSASQEETRSTLKDLDGQDLTGAHSAGHTWLEPQQATAASRAASRPPASPALARRSRTPSSGRTILICVPCCHRGNDERQARLTSSTGDDLSLEENSNIARSRLGSVATTSTLSAPHLTSKRKSINKKIFRGWALGRSTLDQQPPSFSWFNSDYITVVFITPWLQAYFDTKKSSPDRTWFSPNSSAWQWPGQRRPPPHSGCCYIIPR